MFAFSLAILIMSTCFGGWTVYKNTRPSNQPESAATSPDTTQVSTMPQMTVASWQPAPRLLGNSTALSSSWKLEDVKAIVEKGFRSVILPNTFEEFSPQEALQAKNVLNALKEDNIFRTLTIQPVEESAFPAFATAMSKLIEYSSFDALLVQDSSASDASGDLITKFMGVLNGMLRDANLENMPVTLALPEITGKEKTQLSDHFLETLKLLAGTLSKPEYLVSMASESVEQIGKIGESLGVGGELGPLMTAVVDLKDAIPNGTLDETTRFLGSLQKLKDVAFAISDAENLPKSEEAKKLLEQFLNDSLDMSVFERAFSLIKPVKSMADAIQTIRTDKPTVNFSGGSNPLLSLLNNGKEVTRNESGDFSIDCPLKPGQNTFNFEHQGKKYQIIVMYDAVILQKVAPENSIETTGGIELGVSVVARKGSTVKASLDDTHITLKPGASVEEDGVTAAHNEDSDFITYTGTFNLPGTSKIKSLGTIVYSATYDGVSEWKAGVKVTLLPDIFIPPTLTDPETTTTTTETETSSGPNTSTTSSEKTSSGTTSSDKTSTDGTSAPMPSSETTDDKTSADGTSADKTSAPMPSSETSTDAATTTAGSTASTTPIPAGTLLTPDKNHGLGKAQMVRVKTSYSNAHWAGGTSTRSDPTSSPLLEGTYDYITGKTTSGSYTYYALSSGKRVESKNVEVISSGYKLPLNELIAQSAIGNGALVLRFGVDWKIPFNVDLIGQSYSATYGYSGYTHGVGNYTATGVEITFYHTKGYTGTLNVANSALFASAEWSKNTAKNTMTLKLMFKNTGKFYGYQAYFENNQLVIRLRQKPPATLSGTVIYIDPGHGGSDPGAPLTASHATLNHEKQITLLMALKLKAKLEAKGATVHITRTSDTYYSLKARTDKTRAANPDLFISMHCDSSDKATPMGTSAFYYKAYSQPLAKAVQSSIAAAWTNQIYTPANYSDYSYLRSKVNRGAYFYPFEVVRVEECPAILVEYGFGSNLTECRALQKDQTQDILAQATVDGIVNYLRNAQ